MIEPERLLEVFWRAPRSVLRGPVEEVAERRGESVYAVGGLLRDLLVEHPAVDVDLVVVGDGIAFAEELAGLLGVSVRTSSRFLTGELELPSLGRVDVSTARSETYSGPGELPHVEPADLARDLERRDFTVNTLALGLAGEAERGLLSDPRAIEDLKGRLIRVLHARSFLDDPTRLLRGVELEIKLCGRMEPETEALARAAVAEGVLEKVSGSRLWAEMATSLADAGAVLPLLDRWHDLSLYAALLPRFAPFDVVESLVETSLATLARLSRTPPAAAEGVGPESVCLTTTLLALTWKAPAADIERWVDRFSPPRTVRRTLLGMRERLPEALAKLGSEDVAPSVLHAALEHLEAPELALLGALCGSRGRDRVVREAGELRQIELHIGARDLIARGAVPGPAIGRALERTLAARIDGVVDHDGELDYALGELGL